MPELLLLPNLPEKKIIMFPHLSLPFGPSTFLNLLVAHLIEKIDGESKLITDVASSTTMLFSTGGTTAPVTNGICAIALSKDDWGSILVLDTEGLGMGNKAGLDRLVTFALLMSSNLILNTTRSLTENTLHQVCFIEGERNETLVCVLSPISLSPETCAHFLYPLLCFSWKLSLL